MALCRRQAFREAWKSVCNEQGCGSRNGEKVAAPWAGEQQDRRVCSQARGPPSGCAEPSQSHWILRLEEFCILRGRNSLRKDSLSV